MGVRACVASVWFWFCTGTVATVSCSGEVSIWSSGRLLELGATESGGPLGSRDGVAGRGGSMVAGSPQLTIESSVNRKEG